MIVIVVAKRYHNTEPTYLGYVESLFCYGYGEGYHPEWDMRPVPVYDANSIERIEVLR